MDRRSFLRYSSLVSIGGILAPSILTGCRKLDLLEDVQFSGKVIIVGAGAAGLYAGYILQSKGIDFTILEASSMYGGRLGKHDGFSDYSIDTGAQWMHGNNSIIADLVRSQSIKHSLDNTELSFWFNGQIVSTLPRDPFIFEADDLPDISFSDYAHQQGFDGTYDDIIEAIAGDQGASAATLSAFWNNKEEEYWVSGDEDFKFNQTYFDAIDQCIASKISSNIRLNFPVVSIDYTGEKITLTDTSNTQYSADKIIVTVPISILKLNEISFNPALPVEKQTAFSKIGMGPGMKVFLRFSEKFYHDNILGGSICAAYADDTVGKTTNDHVLLAFIMGDQAATLHAMGSEAEVVNALLTELDLMYEGKATQTFISSSMFDYTNKPYIKGAYSYSTVGMGNAREIAAQTINKKIYFAGEGMNTTGHHQTVHGAIESGYQAVINLLSDLSK